MRIGLIQMQCEKGQVERNLATTAQYLAEATVRGVDVVAFPEMSLTGYADPTKDSAAMLDLGGPEVGELLKLSERYPLTALVGLIERNPAGKPFITQVVVRQGALLGCYRKITIKDEELEWFAPGRGVAVFRSGGVTCGLAVCADIHNEAVFAECHREGASFMFELAAPGLYGEQATRDWAAGYAWWEGECQAYLGRYAREYGLWIAVATQAGRTVDEDFPGGGYVFAPGGERVYATSDWRPGGLYVTVDLESRQVAHLETTTCGE